MQYINISFKQFWINFATIRTETQIFVTNLQFACSRVWVSRFKIPVPLDKFMLVQLGMFSMWYIEAQIFFNKAK